MGESTTQPNPTKPPELKFFQCKEVQEWMQEKSKECDVDKRPPCVEPTQGYQPPEEGEAGSGEEETTTVPSPVVDDGNRSRRDILESSENNDLEQSSSFENSSASSNIMYADNMSISNSSSASSSSFQNPNPLYLMSPAENPNNSLLSNSNLTTTLVNDLVNNINDTFLLAVTESNNLINQSSIIENDLIAPGIVEVTGSPVISNFTVNATTVVMAEEEAMAEAVTDQRLEEIMAQVQFISAVFVGVGV